MARYGQLFWKTILVILGKFPRDSLIISQKSRNSFPWERGTAGSRALLPACREGNVLIHAHPRRPPHLHVPRIHLNHPLLLRRLNTPAVGEDRIPLLSLDSFDAPQSSTDYMLPRPFNQAVFVFKISTIVIVSCSYVASCS